MAALSSNLKSCFASRPFMVQFPFGEQGFFKVRMAEHRNTRIIIDFVKTDKKSYHGNLMFSAIVFLRQPPQGVVWKYKVSVIG